MNLNLECKDILVDIQLEEEYDLNKFVFEGEHIFNNEFFKPQPPCYYN